MHLIRVLWQHSPLSGPRKENEQEALRLESKILTHQQVALYFELGWGGFWEKGSPTEGRTSRNAAPSFRNTNVICTFLLVLYSWQKNWGTSPGLALEVYKVPTFPHYLIMWYVSPGLTPIHHTASLQFYHFFRQYLFGLLENNILLSKCKDPVDFIKQFMAQASSHLASR